MAEHRLKDMTEFPVLPRVASAAVPEARVDLPAIAAVPPAPVKSFAWPIRIAFGVAAIAAAGILLEGSNQFKLEAMLAHWLPSGDAHANPKQVTGSIINAAAAATSFRPTVAHWQTLAVEPVEPFKFRETVGTDAKIAINEDRTTPVFSPYTGQVLKLMVKPGDHVQVGTPLFTIKANDMVQAQNDYLKANSDLNTVRSALQLAEKTYNRSKSLYEAKAGPLKDFQAAEDGFTAARNRLQILGKSDKDVVALVTQGQISSEATVNAPIAGTIVQRKVGPGQFLGNGASDPAFVIGDLSTVWLISNVRESDAAKIQVGQAIEFTTLALPNRAFTALVSYVSPAVDPASRRIQVRAEIANPDGALKPEMFANVSIVTSVDEEAASVPRSALIYEGSDVRVWVALPDKTIELRKVEVGLTNGERVQIARGLKAGEKVVTKGSLFIDRIAKSKD